MNLKYLAGSAASVMLGLYLINSSNQQTIVPVPAGPYQSQYRPVSIGVPEPTKGILSWGGTAIALGGGIGCLYMGLGKDKEQDNEPNYIQEELQEEVASAPIYAQAVYAGAGVTRGTSSTYQLPVRDSVQHTPTKSQKVSYTHKSQAPDKDKALLDKYLDNNLCKKIAASNKSVIICSPPGTGKTTLIKGVILSSFEPQYEVPEYHIVDVKGRMEPNKWSGLELIPGCMVVPTRDDYVCVAEKISLVSGIVSARLEGDKRRHPVTLILDDYLATYMVIKKHPSFTPEMRNQVDLDLINIISVGRELNVRVIIITQSPNVDDIGLSAPVRENGAMIILGRIDTSKPDREDGGFGAISRQLSMQQIISAKATRDKLSTEMSLLEPYCTKTNQGMFLSTMGAPKLGIVPDLSWVGNKELDLDLDSIPVTGASSTSNTWPDNEPPVDAWGDDPYTDEEG